MCASLKYMTRAPIASGMETAAGKQVTLLHSEALRILVKGERDAKDVEENRRLRSTPMGHTAQRTKER